MTGPPGTHYKVSSKIKLGAATSTNFMMNNGANPHNQQYNMSMLHSVQQNMPNEYNYKIPAVTSQSKINSGANGVVGGQGSRIGAVYRGNTKKFVMNNINNMNIGQNRDHLVGPNSIQGQKQQRAATQGGHIFGGQIGRGNAFVHLGGSKVNKIHAN